MKQAVGIQSVAVDVPGVQRTNEHWRKNFPRQVEEAEQASLARLWKKAERPTATFDVVMEPYLRDPFRGTVNRRYLAPGETPLTLEVRAARAALAAASLTPKDIGCMIVASFLPDQVGIGNSAYLAKALEYRGAAWNIETACTSGPTALQIATSLVRSGEYERVMVVISCTYSRVTEDDDSLGWFMGDGCGAFIVGRVPEGEGILGTKLVNSQETCNTFYYDLFVPQDGRKPKIRIHAQDRTGRVLRDVFETYFVEATDGALAAAGLTRKDVNFVVGNTPTAWSAALYARVLGLSPEQVVDTYPLYSNIGPALMPVNLHHAARSGRLKKGDIVLAYSIGSASSFGASVMRWGDVALGPEPHPPTIIE